MTLRKMGRRRGQGITEYIIIIGLVALVVIGVITNYGETLRVAIEGSDGSGGINGETGVGAAESAINRPANAAGSGGGSGGTWIPNGDGTETNPDTGETRPVGGG